MFTSSFIESKLIPFCALLFGFGIATSTALMSFSSILMAVLVVSNKCCRQQLKCTLQNKYVLACFMFFILVLLACSWSSGLVNERSKMVIHLIEYAMAPLIWVGVQMPNAAKKLIKAFVCGALLSGILSIIAYLFKYPILQGRIDTIFYWTVFRGHLLHDVFLAIASNFILWSILDSTAIKTSQRLWLILAYLVCLVDIMFLVQGRTGEVMMLGMNLLVILFRFKVRGVLYALLTAIIVIPLLYQFAPAVKAGIASYRNDQVQLQYGNTDTSTGLRHQFHQNTWVIIKQAPLIGHGTGSFTQQYSKLIQGTTQMPTSNPHSDWLLIGAEWGLLGVLLVVWIVISNFWVLLKLSDSSRAMGVALLTGYLIATTQNSFFMDNVTGFAFIFLSLSLIKLGELNSSEHKISCTDKL